MAIRSTGVKAEIKSQIAGSDRRFSEDEDIAEEIYQRKYSLMH